MKIIDIMKNKKTLSFEVFPPKNDSDEIGQIYETIDRLKKLSSDFISVTYGAGGSNSKSNARIASYIKTVQASKHLSD